MGAFLLYNKSNINLDDAVNVFRKKGFNDAKKYMLGDWTLLAYEKQSLQVSNHYKDGTADLFSFGTITYKGLSYFDSQKEILKDFKSENLCIDKMYGAFFILICSGGNLYALHDDMAQYPIFKSLDNHIVSSSFIACSKAFPGKLTLNKMACLEKLCTGMITGKDTLFNEIEKKSTDEWCGLDDIIFVKHAAVAEPQIKGKKIKSEAKKQLSELNTSISSIRSLVKEYGADMGLSGGLDSRLIYGLLASNWLASLSVHTHDTKGAHTKEIQIAKSMADLYSLRLHTYPTLPFSDLDGEEMERALSENVYIFDGYSDSHYGTVSSTYCKAYRETVCENHKVFFTGLSGELYRNYRKITRNVDTRNFFDTYVFYCNYTDAVKERKEQDNLRKYVIGKAFNSMRKPYGRIMSPADVRRYSALVRLPYKASCAAGAFSQFSFYDAPCTHRLMAYESMTADNVIGNDSLLEAEMIRLLDPNLYNIKVEKKDTTKLGKGNLKTELQKEIYSILPMKIIRFRKRRNEVSTDGQYVLSNSASIKKAYNFTKTLVNQWLDLDLLINSRNSYQNTIFYCRTLYEFVDKIKIEG